MKTDKKVYIAPNVTGPTECVKINPDICIGCNACANICRTQTILPNPVKGRPPVMVYPDECWYCACCVDVCPTGALEMRHPIGRRILFKRKTTGEVFRIGQKNPPEKTYFKPPFGEVTEINNENLRNAWISINHKDRHAVAVLSEPNDIPQRLVKTFNANGNDDILGKIVSFLKLIGFERVYRFSESTPRERYATEENTDIIFIDFNAGTNQNQMEIADATLNQSDLISMIKRACVSMNTALYVWKTLNPSVYDQL